MTLRPDQLDDLVEDIIRTAHEVSLEYAWAHAEAFGQRGSGIQPGRQQVADSDSTGNTAADEAKARIRGTMHFAERRMRRQIDALVEVRAALRRAMGGDRGLEGGRFPRLVTTDELGQAQAAKRRREQRGEGWGSA